MKRLLMAIVLLAGIATAQAPEPKLKDSIYGELRTIQFQISQGDVQILQIQKQQAELAGKFNGIFQTALKDSGIDESKYILELPALTIKEKESK